ncbi:MAG: N-acetylmuramoyl-L-alanine amidase [Clostridia bacterium]|nr:N-acetylmuramoyl-L-alanine amidase [Clostridia bacterium]
MKKSFLILLTVIMSVLLCACFWDSSADDGSTIPPATDNPGTSDTAADSTDQSTGTADQIPNTNAPNSGTADQIPNTNAPDSGTADTVIPPETVTPDTMVTTPPAPQVLICIDPGHGGKDSGAVWDGRMEKDDSLNLALKVAEQIEAMGHQVLLTRTDDSYPYFSERADLANNAGADLFISLHRNSFEGAKGVEIWVSSKADDSTVDFAETLLDALADVGISKKRGIKKGTVSSANEDYYVNKLTDMPSCIIELGFIQSDEDNRLYDTNMDAYAKAIAEVAINEALRMEDRAK